MEFKISSCGKHLMYHDDKDMYNSIEIKGTKEIIAIEPYLNYTSVHCDNGFYLITGDKIDSIAIIPFSDLHAISAEYVFSKDDKQYFLGADGFYMVSQQGELNQVRIDNLQQKTYTRHDIGNMSAYEFGKNKDVIMRQMTSGLIK